MDWTHWILLSAVFLAAYDLAKKARVIVLAALKSVIVATSWVFTFTALKTLPITIATPIRASSPALVRIGR